MAKLLRIYNDPPNAKAVEQVVTCLKGGGIVIFPSDTFMPWAVRPMIKKLWSDYA